MSRHDPPGQTIGPAKGGPYGSAHALLVRAHYGAIARLGRCSGAPHTRSLYTENHSGNAPGRTGEPELVGGVEAHLGDDG